MMAAAMEPHVFPVDAWEQLTDPPGGKYEIIRSVLVMSPSASKRHALTIARLMHALRDQCPESYEPISDMEWRIGDDHFLAAAPRPDVMVVPSTGIGLLTEPPLVVVEVLSPSDQERIPGTSITRAEGKRLDYLQARTPLYVEFDLNSSEIRWHENKNGVIRGSKLRMTDVLMVDHPFPITIDVHSIMK
jgi:Uma2 family endonuclease